MDSYQKRNKRLSNRYSNYQPSYRNQSANRDLFDDSFVGTSQSDSISPNFQRKAIQSSFECRVCLNTYQTKRELNIHLHAAQHLRSLPRANVAEDDQQFRSRKRTFPGFTCKVCSDQFEMHSELKRHLSDSDHHWTPKHSGRMSSQDRNSYTHEKYSRRHRHQSLTDARSDKSFDWQNRDLIDAEGERGRSSLSLHSYGSTDLSLDTTTTTILDTDPGVFPGGIYNPRLEEIDEVEVQPPAGSSHFETDNDQSIITSPDNSVMLPSKGFIEVSSSSESPKGVAVIPTESCIPTDDPRQTFPCKIPHVKKTQPKNQNTKWAPVFCDRPKPRSVEKRIPWKLIPIDFSPIRTDEEHPDESTLIQTVPNPMEEVQEVSIDQLAAQLKENTGATFIPQLRLPGNVSQSTAPSEDNLSTRSNRDSIPSHVSSTSLSEDHAALQSPTPCLNQSNLIRKQNSPIKMSDSSLRKSTTVEPGDVFDGEPRHPDSTSWSSSSKCDETTSVDKNADVEVATSLPTAVPISIPPPVVDHQVEADILKALETLSPIDIPMLQPPISILSCSSLAIISNTENVESSQCPVPVRGNLIVPDLLDNALLTVAANDTVGEEPYLFQTSEEPIEETEASLYDSENSSTCSPEPAEEPITIDEVVDTCPCCLSVLDIGRLKIDLTTGNASMHCLACSVHIVMKNVFKNMR